MSDVGTTHEDLERFLAGHHLTGAGLRREGVWHRRGKAIRLPIGVGRASTKV